MPRNVYVNGRYLPYAQAVVHVEDRGLQFADSIYEMCGIRDGLLIDERGHLDRLERSLRALDMAMPVGREPLRIIMRHVIALDRVTNGLLYIQVTRGVAPRNHPFPAPGVRPGLIVMVRAVARNKLAERQAQGVSVISVPETRWARVDIKTTSLIANVLAKEEAVNAGAAEAWFVDTDGKITEGSSSNAWIVTQEGQLVTRAADRSILEGITRGAATRAAAVQDVQLFERAFTLAEAYGAREAFITSASNDITPVIRIDDHLIGDGLPGPVAKSLRACFYDVVELAL
ncbi:MAG: D-amino-acid transaminase [Alphaproteobacteria bacterium]